MIGEAAYRIETERCELGACYLGNGRCQFLVWAPYADSPGMLLQRDGKDAVPMAAEARGYYRLLVDDAAPGTRYRYVWSDGKARADPASRFQPEGVHGPSEVIDPFYAWTDEGWKNPPLAEYVFYELHPGAFSTAGTLEAILPPLRDFKILVVTVFALIPSPTFPAHRNLHHNPRFPLSLPTSP